MISIPKSFVLIFYPRPLVKDYFCEGNFKIIKIMKFTKEDARKELVGRLTARGETLNLSERSINEQIETLVELVANDETELGEFVDKITPIIVTANANVRTDIADGIKKYKEENPIKTLTKKKEEERDVVDEKYEALLKRFEVMENAYKEAETKKRLNSLKDEFIAKAKEKGVKSDSWLKDYAEEITIDEDFDVEAKAESCLRFYNKFKSKINTDISPEEGGGYNKDAHKYLKEIVKQAGDKAKSEGAL